MCTYIRLLQLTGNIYNTMSRLSTNESMLRNVTLIEANSYLETWKIERYDFHRWRTWMGQYWYLSLYLSALYVTLIYIGQKWMQNRTPYSLKTQAIVWNVVMGIFCFTGFYRALPEVISVLMGPDGVHRSLCIL